MWKSRSRLAVRNFARQTGTGGKRNGLVASLRAASFGPKLLTGHEPAVVGHVVRVSGLRDIELRHVARCASNVTYNSKSIIYDMESVAKQSRHLRRESGLLRCARNDAVMRQFCNPVPRAPSL